MRSRLLAGCLIMLMVGVGAGLRFFTFDKYYPSIDLARADEIDEHDFMMITFKARDDFPMGEAYGTHLFERYSHYPPLYVWTSTTLHRFVERVVQFPMPAHYLYGMRALNALLGTLVVGLLAICGYLLGERLGNDVRIMMSLFAALPWALSPLIIEVNNQATIDPLYYPLFALTFILTIMAIRRLSPLLLFLSLLCVIGAIYLKYVPAYGLWMPLCTSIWLVKKMGFRKMLPWLIVMAVVSGATAGWLVFGYQIGQLDNVEANRISQTGIAYILSVRRHGINLMGALEAVGNLPLVLLVFASGIAAFVMAKRRQIVLFDKNWLIIFFPVVLLGVLTFSLFDEYTPDNHWRIRYLLPGTMVLSLLFAQSMGVILRVVKLRSRAGLYAISLLVGLGIGVPMLSGSLELVREYSRPATQTLITRWADLTLDPEGKILLREDGLYKRMWNRVQGGYVGATPFDYLFYEPVYDAAPASWYFDAGFAYYVVEQAHYDYYIQQEESPYYDWYKQLTLLKKIPAVPAYAGDGISFFRMIPPQHPADIRYGDQIVLAGYDLALEEKSIYFRPYWQIRAIPDNNYQMFVHLYPTDDRTQLITQVDTMPTKSTRPPLSCDDPDELIVGTAVRLTLPSNSPPGNYVLAVGLYDLTTGARLITDSGDDMVLITLEGF